MQSMQFFYCFGTLIANSLSPLQFVAQQDRPPGHLSTHVYDCLGNHFWSYSRMPELWRSDCMSVFLGFRGGSIFRRCCGTPVFAPELTSQPGCLFYLSSWYTRKELGFRTAILYSGSLVSGAFGGLITAGITSNMDNMKGLRAWFVHFLNVDVI
jgi:hypothetical protein